MATGRDRLFCGGDGWARTWRGAVFPSCGPWMYRSAGAHPVPGAFHDGRSPARQDGCGDQWPQRQPAHPANVGRWSAPWNGDLSDDAAAFPDRTAHGGGGKIAPQVGRATVASAFACATLRYPPAPIVLRLAVRLALPAESHFRTPV
jgi:hypothetical protein